MWKGKAMVLSPLKMARRKAMSPPIDSAWMSVLISRVTTMYNTANVGKTDLIMVAHNCQGGQKLFGYFLAVMTIYNLPLR